MFVEWSAFCSASVSVAPPLQHKAGGHAGDRTENLAQAKKCFDLVDRDGYSFVN